MSLSLPSCALPLPLSTQKTLLGVGHPSCTPRTATPSELGPEGQLCLSQSVVSKMTVVKRPLPKTSGFNFTQLVGEGDGTPLEYSCLENPMDGGAWWAAVHGVAKSRTRLSDFTFPFHFHALEKEMATHSSVLAWRIPGTGEPGGLPCMGSHSRTRLKRLSSSIY